MDVKSSRWIGDIPSGSPPWEKEALEYVRAQLPDRAPFAAWPTFEFMAHDGSLNEVDLLVLSPRGLTLVEIKSWPETITGDQGTWVREKATGRKTVDNPIHLANLKAKRLRSLLENQKALKGVSLPYVDALIFLSHAQVRCQLRPPADQVVFFRHDHPAAGAGRSLIKHLETLPPPREPGRPSRPIDPDLLRSISRAMEQAGLKPSRKGHQVGDYLLEKILSDGPGYQDWRAKRASGDREVLRRIRIYNVQREADKAVRETIERAAERELHILEAIEHEGILKARELTVHELGPALIFDHYAKAVRLDHYLAVRGSSLTVDTRLYLVRKIAETLAYAHKMNLFHRALSPHSVLVLDPEAPLPPLKIFNWQTGLRTRLGSSGGSVTATEHLERLVEDPAMVYVAPEAIQIREPEPITLDVFSLGAITFHVFGGCPPAGNFVELQQILADRKGLQLPSVADGMGEKLCELVADSTHPDASRMRLGSVAEFLSGLEKVEDELTSPDHDAVKDVRQAKVNDRLPGGFIVKRRLGQGATSIVFLVERDGKERVLKVSVDAEHDAVLTGEAQVLEQLQHSKIPRFHEPIQIGDRVALLVDYAGRETLAERLRKDGRLSVELLQRFGEDLLDIVTYLEEKGIPHRDIKPENLGVMPIGKGDQLHLTLFDFSLSRVPAEQIRAGTVPYLDPFLCLRKPPRWDLSAERYAAAMTLHEMAAGTTPRWGDGKSNPAMLACEVTVDSDLLVTEIRKPLTSFFQKALHRDPKERFDSGNEMLRAWRKLFETAERKPREEEQEADDAEREKRLSKATPKTSIFELGLSSRAANVLERLNVITVENLLKAPIVEIRHARGVGTKTRRELLTTIETLHRLGPTMPPGSGKEDAKIAAAKSVPAVVPIDVIAASLVLLATKNPGQSISEKTRLRLLGFEKMDKVNNPRWPSQTEVAASLEVPATQLGPIMFQTRLSWSRSKLLRTVRDEVPGIIERHGGVMTVDELAHALLSARGSDAPRERALDLAFAVARAATETEAFTISETGSPARGRRQAATSAAAGPRWIARRTGARVFVAQNSQGEGNRVADYAASLGKAADQLAVEDPLPAPASVTEKLQRVQVPAPLRALESGRLVKLAAAASTKTAVSNRLELYPRGLDAIRALRLASGALVATPVLPIETIRERVRVRYPEAERLPDRPTLDQALEQAGLDMQWEPEKCDGRGAYVSRQKAGGPSTSTSAGLVRRPTAMAPTIEVSAEVVEARLLEERLTRAAKDGAFLALAVEPHHLAEARAELVRRFPLEHVSLDRILIDSMRSICKEMAKPIEWATVLRADGSPEESTDWKNLTRLARMALTRVEERLCQQNRTVLLTEPGLVMRYGEITFFDKLRELVNRPADRGPNLTGVWLLIPGDDQDERPTLDGEPIPVITRAERCRVPRSWIENMHRAGGSGRDRQPTKESKERTAGTPS